MIMLQDHGRRLPSVLLSTIRQFLCQTDRMDATVLTRFLHREHRGAFQGATDDPTANHDERCAHAITVARGCRRNRNRHRYRLPRRPPAPTRRMALAAQARRRYISDAFRGARIRKDLGRPCHRRSADTRPRDPAAPRVPKNPFKCRVTTKPFHFISFEPSRARFLPG
jgi:hypothetical protein